MKQSKLIAMLPGAVLVFFLISCGGSSTTEKTATDSATVATADTTAPAVAAPANTIVTTPQNMVVITHKVANFAKWMAAFDEHDSARLASGLHKYVIGRGFMDTNIVLVALKADDITKAKAFAYYKSDALKKRREASGVIGTPSRFLYRIIKRY